MSKKVVDPICGMEIDKSEATATSEHMGKTFYFCAQGCKRQFEEDPMKYMKMYKRKETVSSPRIAMQFSGR